jgi:hypothetical protein
MGLGSPRLPIPPPPCETSSTVGRQTLVARGFLGPPDGGLKPPDMRRIHGALIHVMDEEQCVRAVVSLVVRRLRRRPPLEDTPACSSSAPTSSTRASSSALFRAGRSFGKSPRRTG